MPVSKKAEKVAEAKYDVIYRCAYNVSRTVDVAHPSLYLTDPNLELHSAAVTGNVGLVH